jgi:hypothetical protein
LRTLSKFTIVLAAFTSLSFASTSVATLTSSQAFLLDGHPVTSSGITSWPIVIGDEVATAKSTAILYFRDGSSVKLAAASSVKLSGSPEEPKLVLTSGTLDYKLVAGSKITVANAAGDTSGQSGAGSPSGRQQPAGVRTRMPGTLMGTLTNPAVWIPAAAVGGGVFAGMGIANALTAPLPPVSTFQ